MTQRAVPFEPLAERARPYYWLEEDELDELLSLNRHWIHLEEKHTRLNIDDFVNVHDPALRPWLKRSLDSLDIRIVHQGEFMAHYYSCIDELIEMLRAKNTSIVYLMGGQQFGKSNIWLILLFWEYAKGRFPAECRLLSDDTYIKMDIDVGTIVFLDDCMYSGTQVTNMIQEDLDTIVVCPYISAKGRKKIDNKLKEGAKLHVISRQTPSSTATALLYQVSDSRGVVTDLLRPLDISSSYEYITWIFDHKIADGLSVPQSLFSNTPTIDLQGTFQIYDQTDPSTRQTINIERAPLVKHLPLLEPCAIDPFDAKQPCYQAGYKQFGYRASESLERRIKRLYDTIHYQVTLHR